eukprot:gene6262-4511_t
MYFTQPAKLKKRKSVTAAVARAWLTFATFSRESERYDHLPSFTTKTKKIFLFALPDKEKEKATLENSE